MIGVPSAPKATGAVLAISASPAAYSGGKPAPIISAAEMATGVPKPAAPSMNAPKLKRSAAPACADRRQRGDRSFTFSNSPASTVSTYKKTAVEHDPADRKQAEAGPVAAADDAPTCHGMP